MFLVNRKEFVYMKKRILSLVLSLALLTGCAATGEDTGIVLTGENLFQEGNISWELNYEVPTGLVNVLVDRHGYYADREKEVCFRGEELGDTFDVINTDTDAVVYTGKIKDSVYDDASGEYVSRGDFSELTEEGTYYIETDIIGRSYPFQIRAKVYDDILQNMENIFAGVSCVYEETNQDEHHTNCPLYNQETTYVIGNKQTKDISGGWHTNVDGSKDVTDGCMSMTSLALAITFYGNVLQSEEPVDEQDKHSLIKDMIFEADWLLKMQDASGGVFAGVTVNQAGTEVTLEPVSYEATASFAGAMALCAQILQNYDKNAASTCATAAKKAWIYLSKQNCESVSARFYAASWLYLLTGEKGYLKVVEEDVANQENEIINNRFALYGKVAYISTERKMDTDTCASIMQEIMDAAEDTAIGSRKNAYYLYSQQPDICMERMLIVSIANYVTPSNEYVKVLRNYVHYLLGRNTSGNQYMTEDGNLQIPLDMTISTLEWEPIMLLTMCGIVDAET